MTFDRLQKLGEAKFTKIVNDLTRGTSAVMVARLIQREWRDAQDVDEDTLAKQLERLHTAITNGAFGGDLAQHARSRAIVGIKRLDGSTLNCLDELVALADIQEARVLRFWEKEQKSGKRIVGLNALINHYRDLLLAIQKVRFDLGFDEFKRGIPAAVRASESRVTLPDGTIMQQRTLEALAQLDEIFNRRGIPSASELRAEGLDPGGS